MKRCLPTRFFRSDTWFESVLSLWSHFLGQGAFPNRIPLPFHSNLVLGWSAPAAGQRKVAAAPGEGGSRSWRSGWSGSRQRKARRLNPTRTGAVHAAAGAAPAVAAPPRHTACAIVPLYPNDDTPSDLQFATLRASIGSPNGNATPPMCACTSELSVRNCAFPGKTFCRSSSIFSTPASPEGASV